jgi:hypothetical protein
MGNMVIYGKYMGNMVIYGKYMESPNSVHGEQGAKAGKQGGSGESGGHSFLVRTVFQSTQFLE